ncbi:hypothetical protein GCM10027586_18430 [Kineococcus gypseus]|uniref:general stress protein n=1 Tax=Kineococcus gypseus TaxID=1637102 RepID=UPI003D7CF3E7
MSTHDPSREAPRTLPAGGVVVASYSDYLQAQLAVDHLSDRGFPVQHVRIVGDGVRIVEQVSGRMTKGRAAALGAASGAWFGLFTGLLLGLFAVVGWLSIVLTAVLVGAVFGLVAGFAGHAATGGTRDFTSVRGLAAERYDVQVDAAHEQQARALLAEGVATGGRRR